MNVRLGLLIAASSQQVAARVRGRKRCEGLRLGVRFASNYGRIAALQQMSKGARKRSSGAMMRANVPGQIGATLFVNSLILRSRATAWRTASLLVNRSSVPPSFSVVGVIAASR